jgi:hypothetical protein
MDGNRRTEYAESCGWNGCREQTEREDEHADASDH